MAERYRLASVRNVQIPGNPGYNSHVLAGHGLGLSGRVSGFRIGQIQVTHQPTYRESGLGCFTSLMIAKLKALERQRRSMWENMGLLRKSEGKEE